MAGVEQAIEALSLPQEPDVDPGTESRRNADEHMHGDSVGAPTLDPPDGSPRNLSLRCQHALCPAPLAAQSTHSEPEPNDIHADEHGPNPFTGPYQPGFLSFAPHTSARQPREPRRLIAERGERPFGGADPPDSHDMAEMTGTG